MKPLHASEIKNFLSRFDTFKGSELKAIAVKSPALLELTISTQDSTRDYDWIDISLEFSNVSDAKLLENNTLSFLDMQEGITIFSEMKKFVFCHGKYSELQNAKNSALYIVSDSLKFEELPFSG